MSHSGNSNNCTAICWIISALIGLLALLWAKGQVGLFVALLIGVAFAVILGFSLTRLFCTGEPEAIFPDGAASAPRPAPTPAPAPAPAAPKVAPAAAPVKAASADDAASTPDFDGDGVQEGTGEGSQPAALSGPRDGGADDLKQIKGVGPKLEQQLNALGFYHFDQIAGWSADEVAWVDANLKGFKGRVSRDGWAAQAKILATGGETEFSKRVEDGDVY